MNLNVYENFAPAPASDQPTNDQSTNDTPPNQMSQGPTNLTYNGPPDTTLPLYGVLKSPGQLGSSKTGSMDAINKNLNAINYYFEAMGCGNDFQGYGIRAVYDTKIKCSDVENATAYRYIDGTASLLPPVIRNQLASGGNCGGYGVIPRVVSVLTDLDPTTLTDAAKTETECVQRQVHVNEDKEIQALEEQGGEAIPPSNKISILTNGKIDYDKMDKLCQEGTLTPCRDVYLEKSVVENEAFTNQSSIGFSSFKTEYDTLMLIALIITSLLGFYAVKSKVIQTFILLLLASGVFWKLHRPNLVEYLAMIVLIGLIIQYSMSFVSLR
jgi:hypothetical protein